MQSVSKSSRLEMLAGCVRKERRADLARNLRTGSALGSRISKMSKCLKCGSDIKLAADIAPLGDSVGARVFHCQPCDEYTWEKRTTGQQQQQISASEKLKSARRRHRGSFTNRTGHPCRRAGDFQKRALTYSRLTASRKVAISVGDFRWCTRFEVAASATNCRYCGASRRSQRQTTL